MSEIFKIYNLFIPGKLMWIKKALLYFVYPAVFFLLVWAGAASGMDTLFFAMLTILVAVEIAIDVFIMAGIQKKDARVHKYLRVPFNGKEFLRKALLGDAIRRAATMWIPVIIALLVGKKNVFEFIAYVALYLLLAELVIFITRFFENMVVNMLCALLFSSMAAFLAAVGTLVQEALAAATVNLIWVSVIAFVVLSVITLLISRARIKKTIKNFEGGFYDE